MRTEFSSDKEKHNYFNRMTHEQKLDAFGEILASCRHVAFLGGAGVSTESGIPDFRSKNGLYRKREKSFAKYKPEYLLSYDCLHKKPEVFFSYQNIDGLHQKAGSDKVYEIHGTIRSNHCVSCGRQYDEDFIFDSPEKIPTCPVCGKMVRPDVTLYGEFLPEKAYQGAIELIRYHGQYLIIINKGKTRMEGKADLVFHDKIGEILGYL